MNSNAVAVIGSRNATTSDMEYAAFLGDEICGQGYSVISGGAKGIDEAAMLGALKCGGSAVGVLSNGLMHLVTSLKYREYLMSGSLLLISPYSPEASFNVGNAMGRNKYVYCMSDAAVVVASDKDKGGTWSGAVENLKKDWVPLWAKRNPDENSGVSELVKRGARWLPEKDMSISSLVMDTNNNRAESAMQGVQGSLSFDYIK
ncbi:MAG: hypothetical protein A3H76_00545 [Candidatus Lloydbacteria bacterium RIFCSPLOWO2_02_FULL_54_12]|nr:MAG: hypothetical protein A3H76_00545 [Candidatus Lloydbacteria bacterium RIFCSPLOWO2_02_FULL_54_12]